MKLVIAEKPSVAKTICPVLSIKTKKDGYIDGNATYYNGISENLSECICQTITVICSEVKIFCINVTGNIFVLT